MELLTGPLADYALPLLQGAWVTLQLALVSLAVGLLLGLALAACRLSTRPWLRRSVGLATALLRGVPEFVIVLVCYFGLSNLINNHLDGAIDISPFGAGVFALSVVFAAYASEVFRGAFAAVPAGQILAAQALGMRPAQVFWVVRLPQAWRIALPSLGNLWQSLLKDTSLVSVVGLEDLLKKAHMAAQFTHQPFVFYLAVAAAYLALLALSHPLQAALERRAQRGYATHPAGVQA
ncbi:ABC transporter permease [Acidovorax sp. 106]|uniref:ABC transporter permease n=1 Tax=Acidovorax sp. 106 TaxID=2135637 RepID=UPI000EB34197|nr:ABC transporter permease subunit [Acidovorax sp. 106]RLJ37887.1 amino acid ABC transporter membrane protein 1 (PAAT family) [Acidovorax sp. 106]